MFGILSSLLSKASSGRGIFIVAMLAFTAGSGSALYVDSKFDDASKLEATERALDAQREAVKRAIEQSEQTRAIDDEVLSDLLSATTDARAQGDNFKKEIERYVEDNPSCGLGSDAVRLLNELRAGGITSVSELRKAAEGAAKESRAITISQVDEVAAHGDCIVHYNELMHKNNALIDWIEKSNSKK